MGHVERKSYGLGLERFCQRVPRVRNTDLSRNWLAARVSLKGVHKIGRDMSNIDRDSVLHRINLNP